MHLTTTAAAALALVASFVQATPISSTSVVGQPYGLDPSKPVRLIAITPDQSRSWFLNTYNTDVAGQKGLQAFDQANTIPVGIRPEYYKIVGNHFGTQLRTINAETKGYTSNAPTPQRSVTFHKGVDKQPTRGGLKYFGKYTGGDAAANDFNFFTAVAAGGLVNLEGFAVCPTAEGKRILYFQPPASGCESVYLTAEAA